MTIENLTTTITFEHAGVTATYVLDEGVDLELIADALWQGLVAIGFMPRTACVVGDSMSDETRYNPRSL